MPALAGDYDLKPLEALALDGARSAQTGVCRIGAGRRSPEAGFRTSGRHEIAMLLKGRVRVDLPDGTQRIVVAPSVIVSSPAEDHATTALEDADIFYVLVDPPGR